MFTPVDLRQREVDRRYERRYHRSRNLVVELEIKVHYRCPDPGVLVLFSLTTTHRFRCLQTVLRRRLGFDRINEMNAYVNSIDQSENTSVVMIRKSLLKVDE